MFEYNPVFTEALSCFENHKGVDVKIVEGDFLKKSIQNIESFKFDTPLLFPLLRAVHLCNINSV